MSDYLPLFPKVTSPSPPAMDLDPKDEQFLAAAGEFVLEGLYVNNRLSKFDNDGQSFFKW